MERTTQTLSTLDFVADHSSVTRLVSGKKIAWALVPDTRRFGAVSVTLSAPAAADATTLAVVALPQALSKGQLLHFGEAKEFARVTVDAAKGATSVAVEALPSALELGDVASVAGSGNKFYLAGTAMVEITSGSYKGQMVSRADRPGVEVASIVLETTATQNGVGDEFGYGCIVGGVLFGNLMPDATGTPKALPTDFVNELKANGTGFRFQDYSDLSAA